MPAPRRKPKAKPPGTVAHDRHWADAHRPIKPVKRKPKSPAGDRAQTHGPTGSAKPPTPAGDRPQTHGRTPKPRKPKSPAGDRAQTHGPTGSAKPPTPAGDRPQTHRGAGRFRKSAQYREALRQAYKAQSPKDRRLIAAQALANSLKNEDAATLRRLNENREDEDARQRALDPQGKLLRTPDKPDSPAGDRSQTHYTNERPFVDTRTDAEKKADKAAERAFKRGGPVPKRRTTPGYAAMPARVPPKALQSAIARAPSGLVKSAGALVEGVARDPIGVPTKTAKQAAAAIGALPTAAVEAATHPVKTTKAMVKDYADRAGETYDEKLARIREEGGLPDAADLTVAASVGGGAAARTALMARLPARAEKLLSGGASKTPKKGGPVRYAVGRAVDSRKAAKYERDARKGRDLPALEREALLANRAAGRVVAVVPRRSGRKIARSVAAARGRVVHALNYDLSAKGGNYGQMARKLSKLNRAEKRAFFFATALGIRTAEQARELLPGLHAKIMAGRPSGFKVTGHDKKIDVAARIEEVLVDPDRYFTRRLDETIEAIVEHVDEISAAEPRYSDATKAARRRADQNVLLDLERGVLPAPDAPKPRITAKQVAAQRALRDFKAKHPDLERVLNKDTPLSRAEAELLTDYHDVRRAAAESKPRITATEAAGRARGDQSTPALRYADESDADFVQRGDAAAQAAGLRRPMYFKAERHRAGLRDNAAYVVGGVRAMAYEGKHQGVNFSQGLIDMSTQAFLRGFARNVKASHQWPMVERLVDQHALKGLTGERGMHVGPALDAINRAEPTLERGSVRLWNAGVFRQHMETSSEDLPGSDHSIDEAGALQIADAVNAATFTPEQAALSAAGEAGSYLARSSEWHAVPAGMLDELEAEMRVGTKGGRVWDIAKGKTSRMILLTANIPWFGFQVVSEGVVTALATKGSALNPVNWLGTRRWWKEMSHEERMEVGQWVGLNASGAELKQTRLGSLVDGSKRGFSPAGAVNAWRAMKAHPMWHTGLAAGRGPTISQLNPAELMAAADRGKTNITRLLAAHAIVKKAAVADMARNMSRHEKAVAKVMGVFKLGPREQMKAFTRNPKLLEDMADSLNDWLGDWTTLTAAERKGLNRAVMFYPYVRYSTRLVFYTMPVDHPAVTGMLAELAQLTVDEYTEIFGDEEMPWHLGTVYYGGDGQMKSIELKRANPGMNAMMDLAASRNLNSVVGMAPPFFQWAADQAFHQSSFRDAEWRVRGSAAAYGKKGKDYSLEDRARIAANSAFSLMYPYRLAKKRGLPLGLAAPQEGTQGDDSLLFSPRPVRYAGKTAISKIQAKHSKTNADFENANENIGNALLGPLWPTPTRDVEAATERRYVQKLKDAAAAKAAKRKRYRDTHGGRNPPTPRPFGTSGTRRRPFGTR